MLQSSLPDAITRSTPFFLLSGIALLISYAVLIVAMCAPHQHHVYFFTSGILFIISGLIMLIGLIMYISIFKAEIGSKLRPRSPLQAPLFTFEYGQSFCLFVVGFILTEAVGVLNVFLFIGLQQQRVAGANAGVAEAQALMPCFKAPPAEKQSKAAKQLVEMDMLDGDGADGAQLPGAYYSPVTQRR